MCKEELYLLSLANAFVFPVDVCCNVLCDGCHKTVKTHPKQTTNYSEQATS